MPKRVLVATDGSEEGRRALIFARDYAEQTSSEIVAVTVVDNKKILTPTDFSAYIGRRPSVCGLFG